MRTTTSSFDIAGAKYEPNGDLNYKYLDTAFTKEEALQKYKRYAQDYPYNHCRLEVRDEEGNKLVTKTIIGSCTDEECAQLELHMRLADLWMEVRGKLQCELGADPRVQLRDIHSIAVNALVDLRHCRKQAAVRLTRIEVQNAEIRKLKAELVAAAMKFARIRECV